MLATCFMYRPDDLATACPYRYMSQFHLLCREQRTVTINQISVRIYYNIQISHAGLQIPLLSALHFPFLWPVSSKTRIYLDFFNGNGLPHNLRICHALLIRFIRPLYQHLQNKLVCRSFDFHFV